jgi:hypothetical protein
VDWALGKKARRVLQASAVEAYGRDGIYLVMSAVPKGISLAEH